MKNFKRSVDCTGNTMESGKINYLRTLLRGEALQYFDELSINNTGTKKTHLNFIQEGLLGYIFLINVLSNQKRAMRRAMRKPWDFPIKLFNNRLTELNNYLPLFPGARSAKTMPPEELNKILLHVVPNGWAK